MTEKEKQQLDVLCLVDRNETMSVEETTQTFNTYLETLQEAKDDIQIDISIVLFGENAEWLCRAMPIEYAKPLTEFTYTPLGNAALNDNLIKALDKFEQIRKDDGTEDRPVAVCVITNGAENWSKTHVRADLARKIKQLEDAGWDFGFPMVDPCQEQHKVPVTKTIFEVGGVLDIVCILDRSSSMGGMEHQVISNYNRFMSRMKEERRAKVTTVQFDHEYEILYKDMDIEEVPELTSQVYFTRGSTALYDAVGQALGDKRPGEGEKVDRVILIITDGEENSSREVTYQQVQEILGAQEDHGAKVVYLAGNITEREVYQHTTAAQSMRVGSYVGAPGTVPTMPTISPQLYAQSYSCPVPNIQTFAQPALAPQVYAQNQNCSIPSIQVPQQPNSQMGSLFNAAFETCAGYPVAATQK